MNTLTLTERDRTHLLDLVDQARSSWLTYAPYLNALRKRVIAAHVLPADRMPPGMIAVGDRVRLLHVRTEVPEFLRLVYPSAHSPGTGTVSVLSPMGAALLGARAGESVQWLVGDGARRAFIQRVYKGSAFPAGGENRAEAERDEPDLASSSAEVI